MVGFLSLLIPAIAMLIAIGWGFAVGLRRVRVRFYIVLGCFIISLISAICCLNVSYSDLAPVFDALEGSGVNAEVIAMLEASVPLQEALISSAGAIVAPIVFLVTFVVLCIVTWILMWIVFIILKLCGVKRGKKAPVRIIVYSAVQVILTVFVFTTAMVSYLDVVPGVMNVVKEVNSNQYDPREDSANMTELYRMVDDNVDQLNKAPLTVMYRALGGNATCKALTRIEVGEAKSSLAVEMNGISKFACNLIKLTKTNIKDYSESETEAVNGIVESLNESVLLPTVAGEIIYGATDAWLDESGESAFLGIEKPQLNEENTKMFAEAFDHILEAFHGDAREKSALCADFDTLSKMISILARDGVFTSMNEANTDALVNVLSGGTTVKDLVAELGKNESFKILITDITNIGMRAIGSSLKIPENAEEIYAQFTDDIAVAINEVKSSNLTEEEQKAQVAQSIKTAFAESGNELDLDDEILNLYAETILEDFDSYDNVTATDVEEFFRVFAEVNESNLPNESLEEDSLTTVLGTVSKNNEGKKEYTSPAYAGKTTEELKKGSAAGMLANVLNQIATEAEKEQTDEEFLTAVGDILKTNYQNYATETGKDAAKADAFASKELSKSSVSKDGIEKTASMKSAEELKTVTVLVTMEDLLVDAKEVSKNLNSEEAINNEAEAIQNVFGSAASIMDQLSDSNNEGGMELLTSVADSLGSVLDSMSTTTSVGEEKTGNLLVAVFQSETVRESAKLDVKTATELAKAATEADEAGNKNSYKDTMNGLSSGANIANKMADENAELTEADIREMLENMTPQTANMLKVYMDRERIKSFGVPEEKADISTELIQNLLTEMGDKNKYSDYDSETKGILNIFNLATAASKNQSETEQIFNRGNVKGKLNATAEDTVNSIFASDMVCNAVVKTLYKDGVMTVNPFGLNINEGNDDFIDCKNAVEKYYNSYEGEKHDELKLRVNAVAALLGVENIEIAD